MQGTQVQPLGLEHSLEEEMATQSSILAWKISWTEEPGKLLSMGYKQSGMTELLTHTPLLITFQTLIYYNGYSISSKGVLPAVVGIMVI